MKTQALRRWIRDRRIRALHRRRHALLDKMAIVREEIDRLELEEYEENTRGTMAEVEALATKILGDADAARALIAGKTS